MKSHLRLCVEVWKSMLIFRAGFLSFFYRMLKGIASLLAGFFEVIFFCFPGTAPSAVAWRF